MIHVIATIHYDPAKRSTLKQIYEAFVPKVLQEEGCVEYAPTFDHDLGLPNQQKNQSRFLVIEKWLDENAFRHHLSQPHVISFRESIQGIVDQVSVEVMTNLVD